MLCTKKDNSPVLVRLANLQQRKKKKNKTENKRRTQQ